MLVFIGEDNGLNLLNPLKASIVRVDLNPNVVGTGELNGDTGNDC